MRAACYSTHGPPEVVQVVPNYPFPAAGRGQLLIKVLAAGLNPRDCKLRSYSIPSVVLPLPKVAGTDICGIVISTDRSVKNKFRVGDYVVAMMEPLYTRFGAVAEYAVVNENILAAAPESLTPVQAASIPLTALTVYQALKPFLKAHKNDVRNKRVLIQAGAGGVGSCAVQYCKHSLGMYVIATCSERNRDFVQSLGADEVIDYHTPTLVSDAEPVPFTEPLHVASKPFDESVTDCDIVLDCQSYLYEKRTLRSNMLKNDGWYMNIVSSPNTYTPDEADPWHIAIPEVRVDRLAKAYAKQFASSVRHLWWSIFPPSTPSDHTETEATGSRKSTHASSIHYVPVIVKANGKHLEHMVRQYTVDSTKNSLVSASHAGFMSARRDADGDTGAVSVTASIHAPMRPVIDKVYPMNDICAAMVYVEQGHSRGKNVVNISPPSHVTLSDVERYTSEITETDACGNLTHTIHDANIVMTIAQLKSLN